MVIEPTVRTKSFVEDSLVIVSVQQINIQFLHEPPRRNVYIGLVAEK